MFKTGLAKAGWVAVLLATGTIFLISRTRNKVSAPEPARTVTAVLSGRLSFPLVPENISTIPLYHVHRNLWGTLLDEHGEPSLARLLDVSSDERAFRFELLPKARFSNGRQITSEDVVFSLRRLMNKQTPGHFSAKSLIENITVESPSRFDIELNEKTAAFLFLLSTPEMGIVPKEACDTEGNIIHPEITSGPYTVYGEPHADRLALLANPYFVGLGPSSPKHVLILFRNSAADLMKSLSGEHADFAEFYSSVSPDLFSELQRSPNLGFNITRPSFSVFISANSKSLSEAQRKSLAQVLHEKLSYAMTPELERRSAQLLPPGTFGSLNDESIPAPRVSVLDLPGSVRIASFDKTGHLLDAIVAALASVGVKSQIVPFEKGMDFDLAFLGQGMNTNFPEIEFYLNMMSRWAFISSTPRETKLIMNTIHTSNRAMRSANIETLGLDVLRDARIIPLVVRSYVHVYRKNRIRVDQASSYDGEVPFWKMQVLEP